MGHAGRDVMPRRAYGEDRPEPVLLSMAKVEPEPLQWLWPGRIPAGTVTLLAGDPGQGKSLVSLDIAARVTRGLPWPDASEGEPAPQGIVVLVTGDDDLIMTVRPRLDAAGADPQNIVQLTAVSWRNGQNSERFNLSRHMAALETAMQFGSSVRLMVIDPVTAFLGKGEVGSDAAMHDILAPMAVMANRTGAAVLIVGHLNKKGAGPVVQRPAGCTSLVAAARTVWAVAPDLEHPERHLLLPVKANLSALGDGLAYRIVPSADRPSVARVEWEPERVALTASEALASVSGRPPTERQAVAAWLRGVLAAGPMLASDVAKEAVRCGLAWPTVRRARALVGIITRGVGYQGPRTWRLLGHPAPADPPQAPAPAAPAEDLIQSGNSDPDCKETPRNAKPAGSDF